MTPIDGLLIFLSLLIIYFISVFILHRKRILEKYNLSLWGPALMWRTQKGKRLIDRIAKYQRFWKYFGYSGIVTVFILMILMLFLLILVMPIAFEAEETIASTNPEIIIGLPGLNPIIPLWYGIIAFVVTLIVHEFAHGILARAGKLKVKSLGLLFFIIPIGAFCEPDEEEIKKTNHKNRMKIFSAGPMANIVVSLICIGLISLMITTSIQPAADGVGILSIGEDTPAENLGLKPGMIITSINNSMITDEYKFLIALNNTQANQTVEISYVYGKQTYDETVVLGDKFAYYNDTLALENTSLIDKFRYKGYLGVGPTTQFKLDLEIIKNPFYLFPQGVLYYIGLPLIGFVNGYNPITEPFTNYYVVNSFIPESAFWVIINILYWIFWIDFMAATFNVLPMIPLDGGYIFRDTIDLTLIKLNKKLEQEKREKIVKNITTIVSFLILFIIIAPILLPYIRGLF